MSRRWSGERKAVVSKVVSAGENRKAHGPGRAVAKGGAPVMCQWCGATGATLFTVEGKGYLLCKACIQAGEPKQKMVTIGKDLWLRASATSCEVREREQLLQYLLDENANISDATQKDICDALVAAKLANDAVMREVSDIAVSHGAIGTFFRFGPAVYCITITV